jgi:hypothetical protein
LFDLDDLEGCKDDMRRANEARFYALTTATACALALLAGVVGAPTRAVMQDLVFDQYQRWKPRPYTFDQPVRIIAVDGESLKRLGQWPWPRERLAALVEALKGAGVAGIAFDFLFSEKDRADASAAAGETPDNVFARAIDGAPVILGSFVSEAPNGAGGSAKAGFVTAGDDATKFLTPSRGRWRLYPSWLNMRLASASSIGARTPTGSCAECRSSSMWMAPCTRVSRWRRFASRRALRLISSSLRTPAVKPHSEKCTAYWRSGTAT